MFHASFMTIPTCFVHTLYRFDALPGTNLLTRWRSVSYCFLQFLVIEILVRKYSRNWTKSTPTILYFTEASREPERDQRGALGVPPHMAAQPRGGGVPPYGVGPPWPPSGTSLALWVRLGKIEGLAFVSSNSENISCVRFLKPKTAENRNWRFGILLIG